MCTAALAIGEFDLPDRNRRAQQVIDSYATLHSGIDAGIGLLGFIPVPGAGVAAILAALATQIPIYNSLSQELSDIYDTPQDAITRRFVAGNMLQHAAFAVSAGITVHLGKEFLLTQFGQDFLYEIKGELFQEVGVGAVLSFLPVIGGLFSVGVDVALAQFMTRRVGRMISAYYQNGGKFVGGQRKTQWDTLPPDVPIDEFGKVVPEINCHLVDSAVPYVRSLLEAAQVVGGTLDRNQLIELARKKFPEYIADKAVDRVLRNR